MSQEKFSVRGAQALFGAAFTYAFTGVLVREVSPMWGDKAQVAARWLLVFAALLAYGFFRKPKAGVPRNKLSHAIGLGIMFVLVVLFFTAAIEKTTLANTLFTFYATNLVASFLVGTFVLGEGVTSSKLLATAFA
ncbi:MAG TPA: EamA family transporter, partial [Candidatus Saccharimonadales bacterium]